MIHRTGFCAKEQGELSFGEHVRILPLSGAGVRDGRQWISSGVTAPVHFPHRLMQHIKVVFRAIVPQQTQHSTSSTHPASFATYPFLGDANILWMKIAEAVPLIYFIY